MTQRQFCARTLIAMIVLALFVSIPSFAQTADPCTADATSLDCAQANSLASAQASVNLLNQNLLSGYTTAFNNWAISVNAGRIPNTKPPVVPKSFVVFTDSDGWSSPVQSGPPVCAALPVPPDRTGSNPSPNSTDYLKNHRPMAPGETPNNPPIGTIVTDKSGAKWKKVLVGQTPFGPAIEWQKQGK